MSESWLSFGSRLRARPRRDSSLSFHSGMWAISHLLSGAGSGAPPLVKFSSLMQPIYLIFFTSSSFIFATAAKIQFYFNINSWYNQHQPNYSKRLPRSAPHCFTLYNLFYFHHSESQRIDHIGRASSLKTLFMGKHFVTIAVMKTFLLMDAANSGRWSLIVFIKREWWWWQGSEQRLKRI